mmetsp:Transcript_28548/g.40668  ORF Transcript_28548/g.40668 Transcript_28548/m.40668 type:complete len:159 (+) Transcript_28548:16-492(+)|eukprot:CAMPEP_0201098482 /NCGR_PEP_ID=MMETSP0812-20130820/7528_1 /ASSEMBLY_ACC=CAM_ASM_000668 /TAXON_ID=98059 /ORGANISM="Dinobryon sp., Strain UTEXLB2267" /LENGTH=158 /DNA_ID=CAMNT_0047353919 /DNA_START=7 /DNA_END=483 /DNA_ORIENTATION=-
MTSVVYSPPSKSSLMEFKASVNSNQISDDDPTLVIGWNDSLLEDILLRIQGNIVEIPIQEPDFVDIASPSDFKASIENHLRLVGGGRFENIIGPNTMDEYVNVMTRLSHIEYHPYIQAMRGHAGAPFACCAKIVDRRNAAPIVINRIPPPLPNLQVFT